MKIFVTATLIFVGLIASMVFLESRLHKENDALYKAAKEAEQMIATGELESAKAKIKGLKKDFFDKEPLRMSFSDHTKSENMMVHLLDAEKKLETDVTEDAISSLRIFCFLLKNFDENMKIKWHNIL